MFLRRFILSFLFIYTAINVTPDAYTAETVEGSQKDPTLPFSKGERLTYEVRYKGLKVGESILTFHGEEVMDNKRVYHITFFTKLPAVKDIEELYAQKSSFLPLEVHRTIKKVETFTERIKEKYDQKDFRVDIKKRARFFSQKFSIKKDSPIHNAILLTYYYRTREAFNQNEKFKVNLPTAEFELMFEGIESVKTPLGEYHAYVFSGRPSGFKFWLSADDKRIPLKIKNPSTLGYSLVIKSIE